MKRILALIPLVLVFILTLAIGSQNGPDDHLLYEWQKAS